MMQQDLAFGIEQDRGIVDPVAVALHQSSTHINAVLTSAGRESRAVFAMRNRLRFEADEGWVQPSVSASGTKTTCAPCWAAAAIRSAARARWSPWRRHRLAFVRHGVLEAADLELEAIAAFKMVTSQPIALPSSVVLQ
jgi:hypothetical protein